jgi:hypothetical protein
LFIVSENKKRILTCPAMILDLVVAVAVGFSLPFLFSQKSDLGPLIHCEAPGMWSIFAQSNSNVTVSTPFVLVCPKTGSFAPKTDGTYNRNACDHPKRCTDRRGVSSLYNTANNGASGVSPRKCQDSIYEGPTITCRAPGLWHVRSYCTTELTITDDTFISCAKKDANTRLFSDLPFVPLTHNERYGDAYESYHDTLLRASTDPHVQCHVEIMDMLHRQDNAHDALKDYSLRPETPYMLSRVTLEQSHLFVSRENLRIVNPTVKPVSPF